MFIGLSFYRKRSHILFDLLSNSLYKIPYKPFHFEICLHRYLAHTYKYDILDPAHIQLFVFLSRQKQHKSSLHCTQHMLFSCQKI